jgi:trehalose 6-phosphate phosphatase
VVSGRARADVRRRLAGTGVREVVGNHGIEPWDEAPAHERRAALWQAALRRRLARAPGVTIEDKRFSLAVHYRRAPRAAVARAAILDAVRDLRGFRLVPGKRVLNLVPKKAAHKGTGLEALRKRFGCAAAIYVGDDETDEDAFALGRRGRLLAIRVGRRRGSAAGYYLRNQREIDRLLEELVAVFRPVGPSRV